MLTVEKHLRALERVVLAEDETTRRMACNKLRELMQKRPLPKVEKPDEIARDMLFEFGLIEHLAGYEYTVPAIVMTAKNRELQDEIVDKLYPTVGKKHKITASAAERGIRHVVETIWNRGNMEAIDFYFKGCWSACRGKPSNSEFIGRMAYMLNRRLRDQGEADAKV